MTSEMHPNVSIIAIILTAPERVRLAKEAGRAFYERGCMVCDRMSFAHAKMSRALSSNLGRQSRRLYMAS